MDLEYFKDNECSIQEFENNVGLNNLADLLNKEVVQNKKSGKV